MKRHVWTSEGFWRRDATFRRVEAIVSFVEEGGAAAYAASDDAGGDVGAAGAVETRREAVATADDFSLDS